MSDLWSECWRAKEKHGTCFDGPECVAKGFGITSRVLWRLITTPSVLNPLLQHQRDHQGTSNSHRTQHY